MIGLMNMFRLVTGIVMVVVEQDICMEILSVVVFAMVGSRAIGVMVRGLTNLVLIALSAPTITMNFITEIIMI